MAPGTISTACDPVHGNLEVDQTHEFRHFWPFSFAIAHGFGFGDDLNGPWPPVHGNLEFGKTGEFCHFWQFSWAIAHFFGSGDDFNDP